MNIIVLDKTTITRKCTVVKKYLSGSQCILINNVSNNGKCPYFRDKGKINQNGII